MAARRTTFDKLQRERAKKAKAAAKRARRQERADGIEEPGEGLDVATVTADGPELSAAELLELIEKVHQQFDAGQISFEDFEAQKTDLFERLSVLPIE